MITYVDHSGVRTASQAATCSSRLGLAWDIERAPMPEGYFAPERTRIFFVRVGLGETKIEILLPNDAESGIGRYLERRGPGLHHIGYGSDDLVADTKQFSTTACATSTSASRSRTSRPRYSGELGQRHPHRDRPRPPPGPLSRAGARGRLRPPDRSNLGAPIARLATIDRSRGVEPAE